jgi:hypothetical protein
MEQFLKATYREGPSVVGGKPLIGAHPMPNGALTPGAEARPAEYAPDPDYAAAPSPAVDNLTYRISLNGKEIDASQLEVTATMYSQSIMRAWPHQRLSQAAWAKEQGYPTPETDRLIYIASNLKLKKTGIKNWKLQLANPVKAAVKGE